MRRFIAGFILVAGLLTSIKASLDSQIAAEERKREELTRQVQAYRKQIRQMGAKVEGLLNRVNTLQQEESMARQEITLLELQSGKIKENISSLDGLIEAERVNIEVLSQRISGRIVDMYKYGSTGRLRAIFASRSVLEAVEDAYVLKTVNARDEEILTQMEERRKTLEARRNAKEEEGEKLNEKAAAIKEEREKYRVSEEKARKMIDEIRRKKILAEKAVEEALEAERAAGVMIAELQRKRKTVYLPATGKGSKFDWPLRGVMSSPFGERTHPILKRKILHSGIDLVAPNNAPIKTAAPGEVIYNGWLRGYGRVVVVDHGRGYSTLYAHLSASLVREGQVVKAGAVIAKVGRTGNVTGYHLHFEVRQYGTPVNPIKYLKR